MRSSDSPRTEGSERDRIREGERAAADDERMAFVALLAMQGDAGEIQHVEEAGELELVADGEREAGELRHGLLGLVGAERHAGFAPGCDVVGKEGALGGGVVVRVDLAVDGLVPERAHPDVVGARIAERDARPRLLAQGALLVGEPGADWFEEGPAHADRAF